MHHEVSRKDFFTSQDIATTQDAQGTELKSVANDSKYMLQEETVKKLECGKREAKIDSDSYLSVLLLFLFI